MATIFYTHARPRSVFYLQCEKCGKRYPAHRVRGRWTGLAIVDDAWPKSRVQLSNAEGGFSNRFTCADCKEQRR